MASIVDRLAHAWNAFVDTEKNDTSPTNFSSASYGYRPDRSRLYTSSDRALLTSIINRVAIDVASNDIRHVRLDDNWRYLETIQSGLNACLTVEANIDQGARAFKQDTAFTLLDKGVIALVPVDTSISPEVTGGYDIQSMRVGEIVRWYPQHVRVSLWNERLGRRQEVTLAKSAVAIIESPLYSVMNEPNSTLKRLTRKLNLLDAIDEQSGSGKLDMIIQLPYVIKSEARRQQAEQRRADIEDQLRGSQYGIAYTDGTERITQLNRPVENNLMKQVTYLTTMLYGQLGITEEVLNGTADERVMLNYYNRTIEPLLAAITEGMKRSFLTKTARTQRQSIEYFRDPFKLVAVSDIADIADKFTRNEILSSNEVRGIIGFKPSEDPKADQLVNSNMPQPADTQQVDQTAPTSPGEVKLSELQAAASLP